MPIRIRAGPRPRLPATFGASRPRTVVDRSECTSATPPVEPLSAWGVFRLPHFSPYKCYLRRDLGIGVLLNPKVGSTAFRQILVEGLTRIGARPQLGPGWPINRTRRFMTASPRDYLHVFNHAADFDFRCFVRNPYARLVSAWHDKLVKGFHAPVYPRSMRRFVPKLRRWAADHDLPGAEAGAPFPLASLVSFIASQPEGQRNQHWDTQTAVLLARHVPYRHTYRMETELAEGMIDTLSRLGIDSDWIRQKVARPTNASGKPTKPVYTAALAQRVYEIYAEDFRRFGYDPDSWTDL